MTCSKQLVATVVCTLAGSCMTNAVGKTGVYTSAEITDGPYAFEHSLFATIDDKDIITVPNLDKNNAEQNVDPSNPYVYITHDGSDLEFGYNQISNIGGWRKDDAVLTAPVQNYFTVRGQYDKAIKILPRAGGNYTVMLGGEGWSGGIHEYLPADVEALKPGVNSADTTAAIGTLIENRSVAGEKNTVVTDTAIVADGSENYGSATTLYGKVLQGSTVTNNGDITLKYRGGMTSVNGINTLWNVMDMNGDLVNNGAIKIAPVNSPTGGGEGGTQKIIGIRTNTNTTKNTGEIWVTNDSAVTATVTKGIRSGEWGATTTNEGKINVSGKTGTVNGIDSSNVINTDTGSI